MEKIIYCADIIARIPGSHGPLVMIERLSEPSGLCFPGGKQEAGETLTRTAIREFHEETGYILSLEGTLGTYAEDGRDPRGRYVTTAFYGIALGTKRDEPGKTRVTLLSREEALARKEEYLFDHFRVLQAYLNGGRI